MDRTTLRGPELVRARMTSRELSQEELASQIGIKPNLLSMMLNGTRSIGEQTAELLAENFREYGDSAELYRWDTRTRAHRVERLCGNNLVTAISRKNSVLECDALEVNHNSISVPMKASGHRIVYGDPNKQEPFDVRQQPLAIRTGDRLRVSAACRLSLPKNGFAEVSAARETVNLGFSSCYALIDTNEALMPKFTIEYWGSQEITIVEDTIHFTIALFAPLK